VLLTGAAAKGVIDNVINTSGIVRGDERRERERQDRAVGLGRTGPRCLGALDASGKGAGERAAALR